MARGRRSERTRLAPWPQHFVRGTITEPAMQRFLTLSLRHRLQAAGEAIRREGFDTTLDKLQRGELQIETDG